MQRLAEVFVQLADTLVEDFDVIDFLDTLTVRCVELLDVDAAGVALADSQGRLRSAAASMEQARLLELFELQTDAGPCVDAYRSGKPVVNADLTANEKRWPQFATAAKQTGFVSVHALPMRLRGQVIGALNLFCIHASDLAEPDQRVGQALADIATIGILQHRGTQQAEIVTNQLQTALNSRLIIEQAKGILAERGDLTMDHAFEAMRAHARQTHQRLSDLARAITEHSSQTAEILQSPAGGPP
ncbi:GAF and ANTAR domain-containing protein [Microlunatus elymi]|uniref:GAF and ANTAR domain-containing protein n=1 Tax=Microlunatus elymi TaxID=2596828 RepID=A0A516Q5D3_9ACTN|nr:GAF and ANTAR domain-containing protein [Microlunatus elymi]